MVIQNNRDLQTAVEVEHLYKLNYFSEEFILYGTAYVENGIKQYRFHENSKPVYQFCKECVCNNRLSLPPEEYVKMIKVETGMKERERMRFANDLILQMQKLYTVEIFQFQKMYQNTPFYDSAYSILLEWKKDLLSCFSIEQIHLFQGAVEFARGAKKLSTASFRYFMHWIEKREIQIEEAFENNDDKIKSYAGFLYREDEQWKIFSNAVEEIVWKKRYQYQKNGIFCTPILQKSYCKAYHPDWKPIQWKVSFETLLKEQMNSQYIFKIMQLYDLPSVINPVELYKIIEKQERQHNDEAVAVMRYYALLCHTKLYINENCCFNFLL